MEVGAFQCGLWEVYRGGSPRVTVCDSSLRLRHPRAQRARARDETTKIPMHFIGGLNGHFQQNLGRAGKTTVLRMGESEVVCMLRLVYC